MTAPLVYYMPIYLLHKAEEKNDKTMLDFCELFQIVNTNACIIDRTGTIKTPFETHSLYPIPDQTQNVKDFGQLCIERAEQILSENKQTYLMYSGGMDSTAMLIAFNQVLSRKGDYTQLTVATSSDAIPENPWAWRELVLPNYKVIQACDMLAAIKLDDNRYVLGENADQLFGTDRVFVSPELLHQKFTKDNLLHFLRKTVIRPGNLNKVLTDFWLLSKTCPLAITTMRDFLWWVNFTCKWQSVALRTLSFTNIFEGGAHIGLDKISAFDTFYNTIEFQQLAISSKMDRWGPEPSAYSYKYDLRKFILKYTNWDTYVREKVKVGSLYNIIRQRQYIADAVGYENNKMFATFLE